MQVTYVDIVIVLDIFGFRGVVFPLLCNFGFALSFHMNGTDMVCPPKQDQPHTGRMLGHCMLVSPVKQLYYT